MCMLDCGGIAPSDRRYKGLKRKLGDMLLECVQHAGEVMVRVDAGKPPSLKALCSTQFCKVKGSALDL